MRSVHGVFRDTRLGDVVLRYGDIHSACTGDLRQVWPLAVHSKMSSATFAFLGLKPLHLLSLQRDLKLALLHTPPLIVSQTKDGSCFCSTLRAFISLLILTIQVIIAEQASCIPLPRSLLYGTTHY